MDPTVKGNFAVVVNVSDGTLSDTQGFTITVSEPEPEPEIELTGITVNPKTMDLIVGEEKAITSVTAHYSDGSIAPIAPGFCTYISGTTNVAIVINGVITAVAEGTAIITVNYKGKIDTLGVTVNPEEEKTITITWLEDAIRYDAKGFELSRWYNDPLGPATLIKDDGGYNFDDAACFYNYYPLVDFGGSVVISNAGLLSGYATYISPTSGLPIKDSFQGEVTIDTEAKTMRGKYTQWSYAFGTEDEVLDGIGIDDFDGYTGAVLAPSIGEDWWFVGRTEYIAHQ